MTTRSFVPPWKDWGFMDPFVGLCERMIQSFTNNSMNIERLATHPHAVNGDLYGVMIFSRTVHETAGAAVGAGTAAEDLEHAVVLLNIEGDDMAAQIGKHAVFDKHVPECAR